MPRLDSIWQNRQSSAATTMSPASIISMPMVNTIPRTAVTIGLRHLFASPKTSILPSLRPHFSAFGPKNFGMSRPAVKSLPSAQITPAQYSSLLCKVVSASDICAIIWGLNEFFFAALSITILNTRPWTSVRICPSLIRRFSRLSASGRRCSARRSVPHQLLDLGIQLARHGQRLRIAVGCEQACHLVVAEMHPVRPLIDQHRDWSVACGFRYMLRHVLHDQRIADQKTLGLRRSETAFLAYHSTGIELHEQHQPGCADAPLHHALEFGIGGGAPGRLHELRHVRPADRRFQRRDHGFEWLGRRDGEPFNLDLADRHGLALSSPAAPFGRQPVYDDCHVIMAARELSVNRLF